jgi:hypothetical protein
MVEAIQPVFVEESSDSKKGEKEDKYKRNKRNPEPA